MSPLPSPTPIRRAFLRVVFSPVGLLCGFVVLLLVTCPGARGDDAISQLLANGGLTAGSRPANLDSLAAVQSRPSAALVRSTRIDRAPISGARSRTPAERAAATGSVREVGDTDGFRHSSSALPLLGDPLRETDGAGPASAGIVPMTGPAVGVRQKSRGSSR